MDEHGVYKTLTFNRSCNEGKSEWEKQHTVPNFESFLFQTIRPSNSMMACNQGWARSRTSFSGLNIGYVHLLRCPSGQCY